MTVRRRTGLPNGVTLLRRHKHGTKTGDVIIITVPAAQAKALDDAGQVGRPFTCRLTDEGILFAPFEPEELPTWTR